MEERKKSFICYCPKLIFRYIIFPTNFIFPLNNLEMVNKYNTEKNIENMDLGVFTKDDYEKIVKEKRMEFVHFHFFHVLKELFSNLMDDANKMRDCNHEVTFSCPDHFNIDRTESILREYFKDIGFDTVAVPRKEETLMITLTLT